MIRRLAPLLPLSLVVLGLLGASHAAAPLVLRDVTVIDATGAPAQPHMVIEVDGGRIRAIRPLRGYRAPRGATVVEGRGTFVIPGLWDMHVHLSSEPASPLASGQPIARANSRYNFPLLVAFGITGVRDMSGDLALLRAWRDSIDQGLMIGPRMIVTGLKIRAGRATVPGAPAKLETDDEVREAVRRLKQAGADFVKVDDIAAAHFAALVDESRRQGLPLVGHVATGLSPADVSNAGQRSIEHLDDFAIALSSEEAQLRERRAASNGWWMQIQYRFGWANPGRYFLDIADAELRTRSRAREDTLFATFVRNRTWQVPTLSLLRDVEVVREQEPLEEERRAYIPPRREPRPPSFWSMDPSLAARRFADELRRTGAMHRAGVPIMAGTDFPGNDRIPAFSLAEELVLLVRAGFTPMEALQAATLEPARFLAATDSMGTVQAGKVADLVLLDANPLDDITNVHRVHAVVLRGRYLSPATLDSLRGSVRALVRAWGDSLAPAASAVRAR